eukprot:642857-Prymnesium_polylepis.2
MTPRRARRDGATGETRLGRLEVRRRRCLAQVALKLLVVPPPERPVLPRHLAANGAVEDAHEAETRQARLCALLARRAQRVLDIADAIIRRVHVEMRVAKGVDVRLQPD